MQPTRTLLRDYVKATGFLLNSIGTTEMDSGGITMSSKHSEGANRPIPSRKKHPNEPRLDLSVYSKKGFVSWRAKLQKVSKRKRH